MVNAIKIVWRECRAYGGVIVIVIYNSLELIYSAVVLCCCTARLIDYSARDARAIRQD